MTETLYIYCNNKQGARTEARLWEGIYFCQACGRRAFGAHLPVEEADKLYYDLVREAHSRPSEQASPRDGAKLMKGTGF